MTDWRRIVVTAEHDEQEHDSHTAMISGTMTAMGPRILYLHGFASGPNAKKGVAFTERFAGRGIVVERANLRVPSFEHLRLSAGIEVARGMIGGATDRCVIVGSSLGGLTASRLAERDPRVCGLVLLAPAFQIMARWQQQLGPAWDDWKRTGTRAVTDHTTGQPAQVDFGFAEDALAIDVGFPDVRVPTLIFHGTEDEAVPIDHSRRFVANRPHARLVELADGHELMVSLPRILDEAEAFLAPWFGAR